MRSFSFTAGLLCTSLLASTAWAGTPSHDPWRINWLSPADAPDALATARPIAFPPLVLEQDATQAVHAAAVEHSDAYLLRAKIHKIGSFATLPLFATELALGASLYNGTAPGWQRSLHGVVGAGIIGLFAVNTATGAWNLFGEGWQDKGRPLRLLHGLLMMASDAGILATWASGPKSRGRHALSFATDRATHRNLAVASIGVGTAGYLVMLFGNH
jgi:hypothetical protein